MKVYAIRHIPTGRYLPYRKSGKGFTADEPTVNCIPRLFKKKRYAAVALTYWLKGKWSKVICMGKYNININKQLSRKAEEMQIVLLDLTEVSKDAFV